METVAQVYLLGGIALASTFPIPELPLWREADGLLPRVNIRTGDVPNSLSEGIELDPDCCANSSQYLLRIGGIASYFISDGAEITVQPEADAPALDVRAYLLGTIFAVLCHQRGLLPLHASAVRTAKGVVAFLGGSGHGKSSLAASLAQRGFRVMSDDICLVDPHGEGPAMVIPTAPWLKLWRESLEHLGHKPDGLAQVFTEDDKYRVPLENSVEREPISKLVFLERTGSDGDTGIKIEELTSIHAVALLMNLTHQAYLLGAIGLRQQNFLHCGRVLSQARAYKIIRPWGFEHMESTVDAIETFLRTI